MLVRANDCHDRAVIVVPNVPFAAKRCAQPDSYRYYNCHY